MLPLPTASWSPLVARSLSSKCCWLQKHCIQAAARSRSWTSPRRQVGYFAEEATPSARISLPATGNTGNFYAPKNVFACKRETCELVADCILCRQKLKVSQEGDTIRLRQAIGAWRKHDNRYHVCMYVRSYVHVLVHNIQEIQKGTVYRIVTASTRPPRSAGSQGSGIAGEIEAEVAQPRSKISLLPVSLLLAHNGLSCRATNLQGKRRRVCRIVESLQSSCQEGSSRNTCCNSHTTFLLSSYMTPTTTMIVLGS